MFEMRAFERMVYKAPEVNCEDYEKYPMVEEQYIYRKFCRCNYSRYRHNACKGF